jgi:hypothetical protein
MDKLGLNDFVNPNNKDESTDNAISLIAVQHLFDDKNLKSNSRVKFAQVSDLTKLYLFSDIFNIPFIHSLADNILQLQISVNGLGRKELVELVSRVNNGMPEDVKIQKKEVFR